jgi:deoxyribonuclease-4
MNKTYIGRHLSVSKIGVIGVIKKSIENGLFTAQVFVGSPQSVALSKFTDKEITEIKQLIQETGFKLVIHFKYILNLSKNFEPNEWTIQTLKKELELADSIGAICGVLHCGKAVKLDKVTANNNFITSIKYITKFIKDNKFSIKISIETSAGEGTSIFNTKETFCDMFNSFTIDEKKYLSVTIDSCHVFSSGIDLNKDSELFLNYIKKNIGLKYLQVLHLNGSKVECGAKVDRHSLLKEGFIEYDILIKLAKFALENNMCIILETPGDSIEECIKLIKDLSL